MLPKSATKVNGFRYNKQCLRRGNITPQRGRYTTFGLRPYVDPSLIQLGLLSKHDWLNHSQGRSNKHPKYNIEFLT